MKTLKRTFSALWLTSIAAFLLAGCGGSSVVFNPDLNHPDLHAANLKRDNVRIVGVSDGRANSSTRIGTARVGMFNTEVPYTLNGNLADVVQAMLDTLIVGRHDQDRFVPLHVSVDMFEVGENTKIFGEEGYFACNLRFSYPVNPDSTAYQVVFQNETATSVIDVTGSIESLIYKGMAGCARKFVEETLDKGQNTMMVSRDTAEIIRTHDSVRVAVLQRAQYNEPTHIAVGGSTRVKENELSFHYLQGNKVKTGILGSYCMLSRAVDSQLPWGLGMTLTYYDIENTEDLVKGTFVSFGGRLLGKYYFSSAPTTPYISGNLALAGGTERISYGTREETTFFFGPTFEEVLGLSIGRKVSFEFGSFQVAHFGSKLLPSDVGFMGGISFGL